MVGLSTVCLGTVFYVFEIHLQPSSALAGECDSLFIFKALHLCDHFVVVNLNHENFHSAKFCCEDTNILRESLIIHKVFAGKLANKIGICLEISC